MRPNVLFIVADHHRWDYLGCAGAKDVLTPNLDRLASMGTTVGQVYCNAPLCVPSRISMTTGRYPSNNGCFTNRQAVDPQSPTFLHSLKRRDYRTAMIGKFHHHVHAYDADFIEHKPEVHQLGYDDVIETSGKQGAGEIYCRCAYTEFLKEMGMLEAFRKRTGRWGEIEGTLTWSEAWPWDAETTQDHFIAAKVCEWLDEAPEDQPFYLHAGLVGPHMPYDAPERFRDLYKDMPRHHAPGDKPLDEEQWLAFAASITEVDEKVGMILDALERNGLMENTIILYSSDHGDCAGDNGRWYKMNFYEGSVHVPFIAAGPGIPAGRQVNAMGELVDLGRTVCAFADAEPHHYDQGRDMSPLLRGETDEHRKDVFAEMGSDKMLYDGQYKLMYGDVTLDRRRHFMEPPYNGPCFGRPVNLAPDVVSLYDLENDPQELNNLAADPAHADALAAMKEKLLVRLIENTQARPDSPGSVL